MGLGSAALGRWIQGNKEVFLAGAVAMMSLSLFSAIQEKRKKGKNTGLVVFAVAMVITTALLFYNKVRYGYFI